jgi:hypothetical protein
MTRAIILARVRVGWGTAIGPAAALEGPWQCGVRRESAAE